MESFKDGAQVWDSLDEALEEGLVSFIDTTSFERGAELWDPHEEEAP